MNPAIVISTLDVDRLESLMRKLPASEFPGRESLQAELDRAQVVDPQEIPATVVTMNSTVRFAIVETSEVFSLTLVYPNDMGDGEGRISILAPVGSALLGLKEGDIIEWPKPGGSVQNVRIEEVMYQPEREGQFHR
ncbi:nucleoside diphosphate kinase regulator [Granulosicoccus antarcticus]|uniref:Regulator of nucleoside diphosphate kinase n=1 Tax=Granulosicoccus antarcticus IMCC3135 TaxID=1192854 RepID=A0A2Z2NJ86_9GAMM|nr:nucleoside diphosphate kinase regulator [Granulosicoccus antarcticus]ASJ71442.1 Regulator of nucleoside diphosphate kinase [Granulosicoccus antarcticus IMCC3135]